MIENIEDHNFIVCFMFSPLLLKMFFIIFYWKLKGKEIECE